MTNTPIGIPSGWEEIAARHACVLNAKWNGIRFVAAYDVYRMCEWHDWRVVE